MKVKENSTLLFFGDSVTDAGRQEKGEGLFEAIGTGFVADVCSLLTVWYPDAHLRVINKGVSGDTTRDLLERFDRDVLPYKPDYLFIMIGVNDVWRQFDSHLIPEDAVLPAEYEKNMSELIARAKAPELTLITPYYMEPNKSDPMRARMDEYGEIVKKLAAEFGLRCIDMQATWDQFFRHVHSSFIAWDRIHPNSQGAMLMARTILDALDFDWQRRV